MSYEVCPKCYGNIEKTGHECGPQTIAKDDLCPKCLIILEDSSKAVFHYARDMLQIQRDAANTLGLTPSEVLEEIRDTLEKREERILKEMENGKIKRS